VKLTYNSPYPAGAWCRSAV